MLPLLSRKLGAANFSNFCNGRIDVKSGCSSLVGCATTRWVHMLDSASKGGSDVSLGIGRELRPADRLTCQFEDQRQCLSDEKWLNSFILYPMKSRQHSWEKPSILQYFLSHNWCHGINDSAVVAKLVPRWTSLDGQKTVRSQKARPKNITDDQRWFS